MSLVTPHPPGLPDFSVAQQQPGQQLINYSKTGVFSDNTTVAYCGNVNSVFVRMVFSGAANSFVVQPQWSLTNVVGSPVIAGDQFSVAPTKGCTVIDCLPVLAPYLYFSLQTFNGLLSATVSIYVSSALATVRAVPLIPSGGSCINFNGSVAQSTTTQVYGATLTPGLYSWSLGMLGTVTSTFAYLAELSPTNTLVNNLIYLSNPVVGGVYNGTVVIGTYQPIWVLQNSNVSTSWSPLASLQGPLAR